MGYRAFEQPTHKAKQTMKTANARNRLRRQRLARALAEKHGTRPLRDGELRALG